MKNIEISNLDFSNIGGWPVALKAAVIIITCTIVLILGYVLHFSNQLEDLDRQRAQENRLKKDFEKKQAKAANLEAYKQQLAEMETSFGAMLRRLPSKTEVEQLLVEISQTGLASGVEFQYFKPESERKIDFYAELPIKIKMTGNYHQFGRFVSGIASLPRIVTLHNIFIKGDKKGNLRMEVLAKTYRYMDENEIAKSRKKKKKKRKRR